MSDSLLIESANDLPALQNVWHGLRVKSKLAAPNADFDRFNAILSAFDGATPYVAVWPDRLHPRAMLIGRVQRRRVRCRCGYINFSTPRIACLDLLHGGLLTDGSSEAIQWIIEHVDRVLEEGLLDYVFINQIPSTNPISQRLLQRERWSAHSVCTPHWRTDLAPSDSDQAGVLSVHSPKQQRNWRREWRRLCEYFSGQVEIAVLTKVDDLDRIFLDAGRIAARSYHARLGVHFRDDPLWREMLGVEARRGRLRAFLLQAGGSSIAFMIGETVGEALYLEAMGYLAEFARFSPGKHLLLHVMEHARGEGLRYVDYGCGDAEYKRVFGTEQVEELTFRAYGRSGRARLARTIETSVSAGASLSAAVGGRLVSLKGLKRRWRSYLSDRASAATKSTRTPKPITSRTAEPSAAETLI